MSSKVRVRDRCCTPTFGRLSLVSLVAFCWHKECVDQHYGEHSAETHRIWRTDIIRESASLKVVQDHLGNRIYIWFCSLQKANHAFSIVPAVVVITITIIIITESTAPLITNLKPPVLNGRISNAWPIFPRISTCFETPLLGTVEMCIWRHFRWSAFFLWRKSRYI